MTTPSRRSPRQQYVDAGAHLGGDSRCRLGAGQTPSRCIRSAKHGDSRETPPSMVALAISAARGRSGGSKAGGSCPPGPAASGRERDGAESRFRNKSAWLLSLRSLLEPRSAVRSSLAVLAAGQRRERSLRSLYCCSDDVRGRGAPVTYLSPMASFHSNERITPSNHGIKHLGAAEMPLMTPFCTATRRTNQPSFR
jgi:hypothetical protein